MGRGLGWVQTACLEHIKGYEDDEEWPTTFDIAATVYEVKPDEDGLRYVTAAQHVAVKRALEGLQRQGRTIGFRMKRRATWDDERTELCHHWMTERRANKLVRDTLDLAHEILRGGWFGGGGFAYAERIKEKMRAIGMDVDEYEPNHKASNPRPHASDASQGDQVN